MAKVFYVTCPNCGKKVVHETEEDIVLITCPKCGRVIDPSEDGLGEDDVVMFVD